jgi:NodT family efflux transporter outer membrane factor (OMF) lipoprotein
VQASYLASRQRNPVGTLAPALSSGDAIFNLHTAQVTVSYLPDVFGLLRNQSNVQQAMVDSQRFQVEAAYQTLIGKLVLTAIQQAALRAQLDASESQLRAQQQQLRVLGHQAELGAIAQAEVLSQQTALAQTEAGLPALRKALAQQQHLLAVLSGAMPADLIQADFRLEEFHLPEDLPLCLPGALVAHRPDIQAAAAQLRAAAASVGVAWTSRLPQFTLDATLGGTSTRLAQLFSPGNVFWNLGIAASQTVFDGSGLEHRQRAAEATLEQAQALYRSAVLNAFQNVADVLQALQHDTETLAAAGRAAEAASGSARVARQVMLLGASSSLPMLLAEQAEQQARLAVIQAQASRQADTVALYQALGGGWWSREEPTSPP